MDAFNEELNSFKDRIQGRAEARIEAAMKEVEEVCSNSIVFFLYHHHISCHHEGGGGGM